MSDLLSVFPVLLTDWFFLLVQASHGGDLCSRVRVIEVFSLAGGGTPRRSILDFDAVNIMGSFSAVCLCQ